MGTENRKRTTHIMIRVSPEEKEKIYQSASLCDLSVPAYLRELGLGYVPKSNVDAQALIQLGNLHGDIGRIGGLLKMWLSDQSKSKYGQQLNIPKMINHLSDLQIEIQEAARKLPDPKQTRKKSN
jgi:hypothetical protein